jgi:actin-related protein
MLRLKAMYRIQAQRLNRSALRHFSPSVAHQEEASFAKEAAAEINSRRVTYKKQVSLLRKEYASEVALQRAADQAEEASKQKEEKRRSLERRRLRNIKAAQSSVRELERRRRRELEFQEELRIAQINRDARNERFRKARQLLVDELEAEAPLWLTTAAEVDAAFNKATEQELWALPNSFIGAPLPTEDAKFWNFETHTWHMERTYQTQSESLVEDLMEQCYNDANIDRSYWTSERLKQRQILQDKARLRGMVREAGRRALLVKQRELMQDMYPDGSSGEVNSLRRMPVPNVKLLADLDAMENEGVKVLFNDPTKFFEFDKQPGIGDSESAGQGDYDGPTLGAPRGLKNDVRVDKAFNKAYPDVLGRLPRPDTRTAKEKRGTNERKRCWMLP